jgi:hypothetical protein
MACHPHGKTGTASPLPQERVYLPEMRSVCRRVFAIAARVTCVSQSRPWSNFLSRPLPRLPALPPSPLRQQLEARGRLRRFGHANHSAPCRAGCTDCCRPRCPSWTRAGSAILAPEHAATAPAGRASGSPRIACGLGGSTEADVRPNWAERSHLELGLAALDDPRLGVKATGHGVQPQHPGALYLHNLLHRHARANKLKD